MPLLGALGKTIRYHLGSIALGSLLVALVQFVRFVFEYIDSQSKKIAQSSQVRRGRSGEERGGAPLRATYHDRTCSG